MIKKCMVMAAVTLLCLTVFVGQSQSSTTPQYKWKIVSAEIEGDFMTDWAHEFADAMEKWSNGNIKIEVYPYGSLGAERDIVELCQLGEAQFAVTDYGWLSSFVPQVQVFCLHYLLPKQKSVEVLTDVFENGKVRSLLIDNFRDKGFQPLAYLHEGWQWITSKKGFKTPEECKGMKIRTMPSQMLFASYKAYGFIPVGLDYGEIYSALQMSLIDAQTQPMFANYSMGFHEPTQYITNLGAEMFIAIPVANRKFFDSLPQDIQNKILEVWAEIEPRAGFDSIKREQKFIDLTKKAKPDIIFYEFTEEDMKPFKELSVPVREEYLKLGGKGANEILNALLEDLKTAKEKYGVN